MLNTDGDQTVLDFPMGPAKPGYYSDKEVPKIPQCTKDVVDNLSQQPESHLEKIYQITTSLPVSTALLAAVTSQGLPVGGSLWYLNYSAILVILLTAVAVAISYLSATASQNYCETIFLTIYTPVSQLFNITISMRDFQQVESTGPERASRQASPVWFKQLLFICIALSATKGLSLVAIVYASCMTLVYAGLSTQLRKCNGKGATVQRKSTFTLSQQHLFSMVAMFTSIAADIYISHSIGVMRLLYFILTDKTAVSAIKIIVENKNIEIMEGLEQHYTEGLVHLAEIVLTFSAIFAQPYVCLLYIPVCYFCVYQPFQQFRATVKAINSESLCMSNFEKATSDDIDTYDDVCAVCLCAMTHARITPCKHIFHGKCLKDCLKKKDQCPLCNTQML